MTDEPIEHDEEKLGRLLAALPPAPADWVEAAASLPQTRRDAEEIVALAEADEEFRASAIADLESALKLKGYEPTEPLLAEIRARLEPS
jgi:hypothetical protein